MSRETDDTTDPEWDEIATELRREGVSEEDIEACHQSLKRDEVWSDHCPLWIAKLHQKTSDYFLLRWMRPMVRGFGQKIAEWRAGQVDK